MGFDPSAHREAEKYYIDSFRRHFMLSDGTLTITEQTSSAMTIALGVGDTEKLKPQFLKALHKYDGHFHVGMLGMQYIFRACDICGFEEEAYMLLTAEGYPSYNYWFEGGATVLHEMWADRESKNHHMYSSPVASSSARQSSASDRTRRSSHREQIQDRAVLPRKNRPRRGRIRHTRRKNRGRVETQERL